ncbi:hypothetical protein TWF506_011421 [Arthrobotrys conoides]|uniref:Uncharacterized protein n=1 Tax=Arthrobotrys conoides TaxID=74498 RepID=A0AAN8N153_9PEZI
MPIKYEESKETLPALSLQDPPSSTNNVNGDENENGNDNDNDNPQLPTPPTSPTKQPSSKKRRLSEDPIDHISKIKSEYHPTTTTPIIEKPTKKASTPPIKRGRPAGVSSAFTPEQDAYLIHLRQGCTKSEEIWHSFEMKFHTGKNAKALENRWFAIKDSVLLSGEEDKLLMETIEEVIGDIAASIVEKFKSRSGKKVTKAYVQKKMKEGKGKAAKKE